jgi:ABC-type transporter Mla MlaB component
MPTHDSRNGIEQEMKAKRKRAEVKAVEVAPTEVAASSEAGTSHAIDAAAELTMDASPVDATSMPTPATKEVGTLKAESENQGADTHVHALPASCTVRDAVALKSTLLDLLMERRAVSLDVSGIERIDTAAMQVLCAFVRDRKAAGGSVHWVGTTESFSEAVRLLGLQKALNVPDSSLLSVPV